MRGERDEEHQFGISIPVRGWIIESDYFRTVFLLDHDQRHTLSTGFVIDLPSRAFASATIRYGSGFLDGDNFPNHLPGHTLFDLSFGKSFGEDWLIAIQSVNVANRRFLLDNSNTFGGTHFVEPRQVYVEVKYRFHY